MHAKKCRLRRQNHLAAVSSLFGALRVSIAAVSFHSSNCHLCHSLHVQSSQTKCTGIDVQSLTNRNHDVRDHMTFVRGLKMSGSASSSSSKQQMPVFDFSSVLCWEEYYSQQQQQQHSSTLLSTSLSTLQNSHTLEWHSSISLQTISDYVFASLSSRHQTTTSFSFDYKGGLDTGSFKQHQHQQLNTMRVFRVLVLGCGTSELPHILLKDFIMNYSTCSRMTSTCMTSDPIQSHALQHCDNVHLELTLLDSSPSCIDQLRRRYQEYNNNTNSSCCCHVSFVCADVTKVNQFVTRSMEPALSSSSSSSSSDHVDYVDNMTNSEKRCYYYDVIVDKGLMDAVFCNEGWESSITNLLDGVSQLRRQGHDYQHQTSEYLLVSFRLPKPTQDYLVDIGTQFNIVWKFDLPGSNNRVQISKAYWNV
jgi:hypothetical protein